MAYTIPNSPIRFISNRHVCKPHVPAAWECDPCALLNRRYRVRQPGGQWIEYHWSDVIDPMDDARTRYFKLMEHRRRLAAIEAVTEARLHLRRLELYGN
jgi:hypothetical protein